MIHVFLGPTLVPNAARTLLPEAVVHPPIACGDLFRLAPLPGDTLAIVDGFFHQAAAVRHKELLAMLDHGVRVYGAASIGALRAAELDAYGMVGVGAIYGMYVDGRLDGDDEVAVAHAAASDGYRPLTEALVDVRLHCRLARAAEVLDARGEEAIVAAGRALAYDERTYGAILTGARTRGLPAQSARRYAAFVARQSTSAKAQDALELLRRLREPPESAPRPRFSLARTSYMHSWSEQRTGRRDARGVFIAERTVLNFVRVAVRDYPRWHERVALEELAALYGELRGVTVPAQATLLRRFGERRGLRDPAQLDAWCDSRQLTTAELLACLERRCRIGALLGGPHATLDEPAPITALQRLVFDYAVALGLWREDALPRAALAAWLTPAEAQELDSAALVARVAVRTCIIGPGVSIGAPFVGELKLSGAYAAVCEELLRGRPAPPSSASDAEVLTWCASRWGVERIAVTDVLDRGLANVWRCAVGESVLPPLARRARPLYGRAEQSGDFSDLRLSQFTRDPPPSSDDGEALAGSRA